MKTEAFSRIEMSARFSDLKVDNSFPSMYLFLVVFGTHKHTHSHTHTLRVEGEGNAVITDVIYSSRTSEDQATATSGGSKEDYERLKEEVREEDRALRQLQFREEVLKKEKELLSQFANHVAKAHSVKVCVGVGVGVCVGVCECVCVFQILPKTSTYSEKSYQL